MARRIGRLASTGLSIARSALDSSGVRVGYYNVDNFGDQLTPDIFKFFGINTYHCPNFRFSSAVGVGSILHMLPKSYGGYILGSGLISDECRFFPEATALLVRGHLTRSRLGLPDCTPVGDPGLLAGVVYKDVLSEKKKYDVGLVPHFTDWDSVLWRSIAERSSDCSSALINVRNPPARVINEISECDYIMSSSLHGLIVAESLNIPSLWIASSAGVIGGNFKYHDYYSCFGINREPHSLHEKDELSHLVADARRVSEGLLIDVKSNITRSYKKFAKTMNRA